MQALEEVHPAFDGNLHFPAASTRAAQVPRGEGFKDAAGLSPVCLLAASLVPTRSLCPPGAVAFELDRAARREPSFLLSRTRPRDDANHNYLSM